jgi:hypothetical protein
MMEAASTSETSVNFYQTTGRYDPEDSYLHTRRRENLKCHFFLLSAMYNIPIINEQFHCFSTVYFKGIAGNKRVGSLEIKISLLS